MTRIAIILGSTRPGRNGPCTRSGTTRPPASSATGPLVARAVEHLRLVMGELQVADVRAQVALSLFTDFTDFSQFTPATHQAQAIGTVLEQVVAWSGALAALRN